MNLSENYDLLRNNLHFDTQSSTLVAKQKKACCRDFSGNKDFSGKKHVIQCVIFTFQNTSSTGDRSLLAL